MSTSQKNAHITNMSYLTLVKNKQVQNNKKMLTKNEYKMRTIWVQWAQMSKKKKREQVVFSITNMKMSTNKNKLNTNNHKNKYNMRTIWVQMSTRYIGFKNCLVDFNIWSLFVK